MVRHRTSSVWNPLVRFWWDCFYRGRHERAAQRRKRRSPLCVELLEDRTTPAVVTIDTLALTITGPG